MEFSHTQCIYQDISIFVYYDLPEILFFCHILFFVMVQWLCNAQTSTYNPIVFHPNGQETPDLAITSHFTINHVCLYVFVSMCMHVCVHMYVCTCARVHVCVHVCGCM